MKGPTGQLANWLTGQIDGFAPPRGENDHSENG